MHQKVSLKAIYLKITTLKSTTNKDGNTYWVNIKNAKEDK